MSDLQCPATVVLVGSGRLEAEATRRVLAGRAVAAVFDLAPPDGPALRRSVDDLSDLHRGETIVVVAAPRTIADALGMTRDGQVVVAVDSDGWTVLDQ